MTTDADVDPMAAEFDTVARWTAQVASDLGHDYAVPAGCRGSGSPSWLDWLIEALAITADDAMIDVGAGVGGPAAYVTGCTGALPVLTDPEAGACQAARSLFGAAVVRGEAAALPFATARFDVAWCLGVLCTTPDDAAKVALLRELRRVVTPQGRVGLLVLVATTDSLEDPPSGNHFPTVSSLPTLLARAGFAVQGQVDTSALDDPPDDWVRRSNEVDSELERRFGATEAWKTAQSQSARIAEMIRGGQLVTTLVHLVAADEPRE